MNCPGGCIGGGGQPLGTRQDVTVRNEKRTEALNLQKNNMLFCHENREVYELYKSYLNFPLSEKAESILHKTHKNLSKLINK